MRFVIVEKTEQIVGTRIRYKLVLHGEGNGGVGNEEENLGRFAFVVDAETFGRVRVGQNVAVEVAFLDP